MALLELEEVVATYDNIEALKGLASLSRKAVVTLLGANRAGKARPCG
jgi:ABC-type branched-subunit amino acid transport system ATPase component